MAPKVFLTGASGYIGGAALDHVVKAHPDYEFTLFVRNEKRAEPMKAKYPQVKFVYGTFDESPDVVEKAAADADIVIHTADSSDNLPAAKAITKGLVAGHSASKPGYYIHVSGTSILTWYDAEHERFGEPPLPEQKYWDVQGVDKILTIPDPADHRDIDKIVQETAKSDAVKLAIVCPPTIYGEGPGAINTRSIQIPDLARGTLQKGFAPIVGAGKTEWDNVHIDDLGDLFVKLVNASQDPSKKDDPEVFSRRAYYFAENGSHVWADVARWIADEASGQGYLPEALTKTVTQKEATQMDGQAVASYGSNSKGVAERARKYLGWTPKGVPVKDTIKEVVELEAKRLGLTPKEKKG